MRIDKSRGYDEEKPRLMPWQQIAREMAKRGYPMSRQRVVKIHNTALEKMRKALTNENCQTANS